MSDSHLEIWPWGSLSNTDPRDPRGSRTPIKWSGKMTPRIPEILTNLLGAAQPSLKRSVRSAADTARECWATTSQTLHGYPGSYKIPHITVLYRAVLVAHDGSMAIFSHVFPQFKSMGKPNLHQSNINLFLSWSLQLNCQIFASEFSMINDCSVPGGVFELRSMIPWRYVHVLFYCHSFFFVSFRKLIGIFMILIICSQTSCFRKSRLMSYSFLK
jgi:hypothetical protein